MYKFFHKSSVEESRIVETKLLNGFSTTGTDESVAFSSFDGGLETISDMSGNKVFAASSDTKSSVIENDLNIYENSEYFSVSEPLFGNGCAINLKETLHHPRSWELSYGNRIKLHAPSIRLLRMNEILEIPYKESGVLSYDKRRSGTEANTYEMVCFYDNIRYPLLIHYASSPDKKLQYNIVTKEVTVGADA